MKLKNEVKIRRMEEQDLNSTMDLVHRLKKLNEEFDSTFHVSEEGKEEATKYMSDAIKDKDKHILLVADLAGKIIGIIRVDLLTRLYYNPSKEARIVDFYVMPEHRRKSVGKALMTEMYKILKEREIKLVTAEFPSKNLIALGFYKGIGYREIVNIYGKQIEPSGEES